MNRPFYILFFFYFFSFESYCSHAQTNLVPNGSFELYDTCLNTSDLIQNALGWYKPTTGTSDYFNSCWIAGVPNNFAGFQYAKSGNAYAGLIAYDGGLLNVLSKEYIQTQLIEPLVAGKEYCVSFYVSLAEKYSDYAVAQMGIHISTIPVSSSNYLTLPYTPQIESPDNIFITDTLGWTLVSGTYISNGGENYITIGNFKDTSDIDTLPVVNPFGSINHGAYYYIDDVSIICCESNGCSSYLSIPNIFSPNNDGINDQFNIKGLNYDDKVRIYNRWGLKIYEFVGINDSWNGRTTSGEECENGIYYYVIENKRNQKGFIQLLR